MALLHHADPTSSSNSFIHGHHGQTARLLPELRLALARLYSLPLPELFSSSGTVAMMNGDDAHEFLITFQSRNLKRKRQSWQQRQRDLQKTQQQAVTSPSSQGIGLQQPSDWKWGSTWWACWMVLAYSTATTSSIHFTERLFCAQTLVHRMQRLKLVEAVDLEMELFNESDADPMNAGLSFSPHTFSQLQFGGIHPLIAHFLRGWGANANNDIATAEESWKGQITLNVLAAILFMEVVSPVNNDLYPSHLQDHSLQPGRPSFSTDKPFLSTLASAMALTALRLQYNTPSTAVVDNQQSTSIVSRVTQALEHVIQVATINMREQAPDQSKITLLFTVCFGAIPDAIWCDAIGSSGSGAEPASRAPRISMDPNVLTLARQELRQVGIRQVWDVLAPRLMQTHPELDADTHHRSVLRILSTLKQWAEVMPLPFEMIEATVPGVNSILLSTGGFSLDGDDAAVDPSQISQRIAQMEVGITFLTAIFDIRAVSRKDLFEEYRNQYELQRTPSQDRRRRKIKANQNGQDSADDEWASLAQAEFQLRGEMACRAAHLSWSGLQTVVQWALQLLRKADAGQGGTKDYSQEYENLVASLAGGGPVGCMVSCAHACLPFLLAQPMSNSTSTTNIKESFLVISREFQEVCACPSRAVRSLAYEPLLDLHQTLLDVYDSPFGLDRALENAVVDHLAKCCVNLASSCGYPPMYFKTPEALSDEDLEIERNDVRDVLRTVAGSDSGSSTSAVKNQIIPPSPVTLRVLHHLVLASWSTIVSRQAQVSQLDGETSIHVLSALAKPLNHLAVTFSKLDHQYSSLSFEILCHACQALGAAAEKLVEAFGSTHLIDLFPISRVSNLATASLAPMMSALIDAPSKLECDSVNNTTLQQLGMVTLRHVITSSALSIMHIPELLVESASDGTHYYEARAAMRAPGGEDHVGCLALMRLSFESRILAQAMIEAQPTILHQLCQLHDVLKQSEQGRERGKFYGKGVSPKSRRILLKAIAHLDAIVSEDKHSRSVMHDLFRQSIEHIVRMGQESYHSTEHGMYSLCEVIFDLAEFSSTEIFNLFDNVGQDTGSCEAKCTATLREAGLVGYKNTPTSHELQVEWGRMRASLFIFIGNSAIDDMAPAAVDLLLTWIRAESEATLYVCQQGPTVPSSLFCVDVISEDHVPAGIFVKVLGDVLNQCKLGPCCAQAIYDAAQYVLPVILQECPQPTTPNSFQDPRPTMFEAWLYTMNSLMKWIRTADPAATAGARQVLLDSCIACLSLIFYPTVNKPNEPKTTRGLGMSLDGPHSRAIMEFLENYFQLGPDLLYATAVSLAARLRLPSEDHNIGVIGAALFRGVQGALPPWAVEYLPGVFASFYHCLGKDPQVFGQCMLAAINVRLSTSAMRFGSVMPGMLLSGPYFEGTGAHQKQAFVEQAVELARADSLPGWKRMKWLVKQACGGKKKDTDFQQKPPPTNWEFDRI